MKVDYKVKGKKVQTVPLEVHPLGFWQGNISNRPVNLITQCTNCHTPANHKQGNFLFVWEPKLNSFRAETFINMVRLRMVEKLKEKFFEVEINHTSGYFTKNKRFECGIEKTYSNIAEGSFAPRSETYKIEGTIVL